MSTKQLRESEAQFQQWIIELARRLGWICAHFRPARTQSGWRTPVSADGAGFPDLVLAKNGRVIFAEVKTKNGKLSPAQRRWLIELPDARVWRPEDRDEILQELKTPRGTTEETNG